MSFGEFNQIPIPHDTEHHKNDVWYNDKELRTLRKKVEKLVRKGEGKLDQNQDCWRGLEAYVKQLSASNDAIECNQIILKLQNKVSEQDDGISVDLRDKAATLLRKALREGARHAAQDAAEAHAIYMETMSSEELKVSFQTARVA